LTNENITPRVQEFLPLALFVFFLSYVAFEAIHLVHSPGWNWRRTAKGCLEAFAFVLISVPLVAGATFLASRMADRLDFDTLEEAAIRRYLAFAALLPLLLYWNGRRWRRMSKAKSSRHTPSSV
jgi:hypothetical protein